MVKFKHIGKNRKSGQAEWTRFEEKFKNALQIFWRRPNVRWIPFQYNTKSMPLVKYSKNQKRNRQQTAKLFLIKQSIKNQ